MKLVAQGPDRLDRFLVAEMPEHSRTKLSKWIESGGVTVDGEVVSRPGLPLKAGMVVDVADVPESAPHNLEPAEIPLVIAYEDEWLLVVNKPRGMAAHPAPNEKDPTLVNALLARSHALSSEAGDFRPGIVHRLDKDTTGLMVVAKTDNVHRKLAEEIRLKIAQRRYVALVAGNPVTDRFTINAPVGRHPGMPTRMSVNSRGKEAVTHIRVLKRLDVGVLVSARLETGRTHQIRVHLSEFGFPVIGDPLYGRKNLRHLGPLQLHAGLLAFTHPVSGERVVVYADPPDDFIHREEVSRELIELWN